LDNIKEKLLAKFENKGNKKTIENLVVFVIILVATIIFINYIWNGDKKKDNNKQNVLVNNQLEEQNISSSNNYTSGSLENQIEELLKKLAGVEDVKVLITYSETNKVVPMYNEDVQQSTTQEEDNQGGVRTINENSNKKEVVYQENNGQKIVVTSSVVTPEIKGAVVLAKGASNSSVKSNIIQAVEAATGLPTHKIQVFEMK
jgi:stage III sporulation protein AG